MRVALFDPEADALTSLRKGQLFEHLLRRIAHLAGYRDVELRRKHRSLEYDIEGRGALHGVRLLGEAKATEARISGKEVAAFVGKLVPFGLGERVDGLFVSVAPFTAEARDYLDGIAGRLGTPPLAIGLRTLAGDQIAAFLAEHWEYASEAVLRARVRELHGLELREAWLVVTEGQDLVACACGRDAVGPATALVVLGPDGGRLALAPAVLARLQAQVEGLAGLEPPRAREAAAPVPGIVAGAGWFDHRFPAPPDCFVGREEALREALRAIGEIGDRATALRAVQVLSRTGVGKSSLLLKLAAELPETVTLDARHLRAPADVRRVAALAVEPDARAATLVLLVDQFEAALERPPVFEAVLDLVETTTSHALPIVWVLARRNDVRGGVDPTRLNELSLSIALADFSPAEARTLLARLQDELGEPLLLELATALVVVSDGFPWLLKRLCAHVLQLHRAGLSQRDMLAAGLFVQDLFAEDLAGLHEHHKALLRCLAARLPATAGELCEARGLDALVARRLLRRRGDRYDTYHDLFRAYLLAERPARTAA